MRVVFKRHSEILRGGAKALCVIIGGLGALATLEWGWDVRDGVPLNQMQTAGRLDDAAHLAGLQAEGGVLKLLLHVALAKVAQIAALAGRGAVGLGQGELAQGDGARLDLLLVAAEDLEGLILGARDFGLVAFPSLSVMVLRI